MAKPNKPKPRKVAKPVEPDIMIDVQVTMNYQVVTVSVPLDMLKPHYGAHKQPKVIEQLKALRSN